ncbi:YHYH protein [Flavicella sediminum]|uniref:YHYH protein n=1 Tax=Flavicella sediminum TaxID=2585141 RepID=UPI00112123A9|nr:YHYH protein [Flavicella sediminum]
MKQYITISMSLLTFLFFSCTSSDSIMEDAEDEDETTESVTELHAAFAEFDTTETDIYLSANGTTVTIEASGLPNHKTGYWGEGHTLYYEEDSSFDPTPTTLNENGNYDQVITVDAVPSKASNTTSTSLGSIGVAISGAAIYNDQEGSGSLDGAAVSLDWTGAHIGPDVYHYHLEPHAMSNDDKNLIGILKDGFFIYGRKCDSTNTYPTNLDSSGGHTSTTQHSDGEEEYHYHVINEIYSTSSLGDVGYILFAGPFQGSL